MQCSYKELNKNEVPKLKGKGIIALGVLVVIELVQILCFS